MNNIKETTNQSARNTQNCTPTNYTLGTQPNDYVKNPAKQSGYHVKHSIYSKAATTLNNKNHPDGDH